MSQKLLDIDRQRALIHRLLPRAIGELPNDLINQINHLPLEKLEILTEKLWDFTNLNDFINWLENTEP